MNFKRFISGIDFPVFLLAAALVYEGFLLAVVFAPESTSAWGGFAGEFKQWCFKYDARTGGVEWAAVWVMLVEPAFVVAITAYLWRSGLGSLLRPSGWLRHRRAAGAGVAIASLAMAGLYAYGRPAADADNALPFPGERIRTELEPPSFKYADQKGSPFSLESLRGRIVIVTGVYAMCSASCPEILKETHALLAELSANVRDQVSVVAISLNPEDDTTALMDAVTTAYGFSYPEFRYVNGDSSGMHEILTQFGFAPVKNPQTRLIDHSNLFLVIDPRGRIAYRFTLDPRRRTWLREAVISLSGETGAL